MLKRILLSGLFLSLVVSSAFAFNPKDPIGWEETQAFPSAITTNGGVYVATFVFANQTGYNLPANTLQIVPHASPSGEFTYIDNCSGQALANNATCTVTADLTPITDGVKTLQLYIQGWSADQVPVPQPAETTTSSSSTSIAITGQLVTTPWPATLSVSESQPFSFLFTNTGTTAATGIVIACSTNATSCFNNCGSSLGGGATCNVTGTIVPNSLMAGTSQVVSAILDYNQGAPVTASAPAVLINPASGFVGVATPVSATILKSVDYTVTFTFTNYNSSAIAAGSTVTLPTAPTGTTFVLGANNCASAIAPDGGSCAITGTYTDNNVGPDTQTLTATVDPATTAPTVPAASASSTLTVVGTSTGSRTITFKNQCSFPVWWGMVPGAYSTSAYPKGKPCTSASDCPTGTTCVVSAGLCYWNTYAPTSNNFMLAASGGTQTVVIPSTPAVSAAGLSSANEVLWHGGFAGRTGCQGSTCVTADCAAGSGACQPGGGFQAPVTQAEVTFQPGTSDTYDIEVIDGFNIPVEVEPTTGQSTAPASPSGYSCTATGNPVAANGFSACSFAAGPPSGPLDPSTFYWVTPGGPACSTQSACATGTICGIAQVPVNPGIAPPKLSKSCGKFLGYMTPKQACVYDIPNNYANANAFGFNCTTNTSEGGQVLNAYGCTGTFGGSCYSSGTPCCGCINWESVLPTLTPAATLPTTTMCQSQDTAWSQSVPQYITWMKQACPSNYTYPYDDKSSTFQCAAPSTAANVANYSVTFCPGSGGADSGIPAAFAADEGRNG